LQVVRQPDTPVEIMAEIKRKAKRAEMLGEFADEEGAELQKEMEQQAEAAVLKYHTRSTDLRESKGGGGGEVVVRRFRWSANGPMTRPHLIVSAYP
jgi:hypothetical protein